MKNKILLRLVWYVILILLGMGMYYGYETYFEKDNCCTETENCDDMDTTGIIVDSLTCDSITAVDMGVKQHDSLVAKHIHDGIK